MSSTNIESSTLPELLSLRSQIDAAISAACGGDASAAVLQASSGKGPKKPSARAGQPTAYGAFSSKVQKEHAEEIKAFKEANPEMKGAHMAWVGKYKEEHPDIYEAFKTEWAEAHPKPAAPAAAVEGAEGEEAKPKKVLTPEHLAKMKAGREAAKAAKAAAAAAGVEPAPLSDSEAEKAEKAEKPKRVLTPEHLAKLKAGREAAKALKDAEKAAAAAEANEQSPIALMPEAAPDSDKAKKPKKAKKAAAPVPAPAPVAVPVAAPAPVPVAVAEEAQVEAEELPFKHGGAVYIRMGISNASGQPKWASNDLWMSKKGARGPYAGELMEDGSINADAEEPAVN
jgi:hypothetical protein